MPVPDADELARKTLELWQDQLSALAGDPEAGAAMVKLMTMATMGPAAAMKVFSEAVGGSLRPNGGTGIQQPRQACGRALGRCPCIWAWRRPLIWDRAPSRRD
jgi:hypothetical protein